MILELHAHSKYSFDSILEPKNMIHYAKKKGLDGIAITDHNTIKGGIIAKDNNKISDFYVIIGCEIHTDVGDIIGLFLNEDIKSRNSMEVIDEIKEQSGIVILPHPFRSHKLSDQLIQKVDLLEVFNSRSTNEENYNAMNLAIKSSKRFIAGSDAHFSNEIGIAKSIFTTKKGLKKDILNGSTRIEGVLSPKYLQPLSQTIKAIKTKTYQDIPRNLLHLTKQILY